MEKKEYTFTFNNEELKVIFDSLGETQAKYSRAIMNKIEFLYNEQNKEKEG
jgi:hypothetical protein